MFVACMAVAFPVEIVVFSPARRASRKLLERMYEVRSFRLCAAVRFLAHTLFCARLRLARASVPSLAAVCHAPRHESSDHRIQPGEPAYRDARGRSAGEDDESDSQFPIQSLGMHRVPRTHRTRTNAASLPGGANDASSSLAYRNDRIGQTDQTHEIVPIHVRAPCTFSALSTLSLLFVSSPFAVSTLAAIAQTRSNLLSNLCGPVIRGPASTVTCYKNKEATKKPTVQSLSDAGSDHQCRNVDS